MKTSILLLLMLQLSLSALSQGSYKALNFDGQNDYVKVEDNASLDFENEFTLEAWVKGGTAGFSGVQRANGSTPQFQVAGDKIHFVYCNGGNIYTAVMNTSSMNWIPQFREQGLSPQLQVVGNKIYYVFIKWDGFYNQLWFASSNVDGTGWTASQKTNTPFDKSSPQMQVVGNNVYLVFVGTQNLGGGNYSYFIVTATGTTNGGAGSFSFTIHDDGSPGKQNPQMQVVGNQIYYVYRRTTDNPFTQKIVTASSQLDGSGWVMIERTGGLSPQLQVDVGKIYYVFVNNGGILMTAQSNLDGTGWIESGAGYSAQEPQFQKVGNNYFYTWTNNLCLFASEVIAGITGWNTVQLGCGVDYHAQLQVVGAKVYFTWEDNAKLYTGERHGNIINKGDAYGFGLLSGNLVTGFVNGGMDKLKFFAEATSNTSGLIVQAFLEPDWNHIALTFSNSVLKLYINGLLKASNTLLNGSAQTNDFPLIIGDDFAGDIDEVRVWNSGTDQNVLQDYMNKKMNAGHANLDKLKGYWKFDEDVNIICLDSSDNGNNGTLMNMMIPINNRKYSGAPIGDESSYKSGIGSEIELAENLDLAVTLNSSTAETYLYGTEINQSPINYTAIPVPADDIFPRYWDVKGTYKPSYNLAFSWEGIPLVDETKPVFLLRRDDGSIDTWINMTNLTTFDTVNNCLRLDSLNEFKGQYALAGLFADPWCVLEGTITNAVTGDSIEGAQIILTLAQKSLFDTLSDAHGHYKFIDLPAGYYNIDVTAENYEPENRDTLIEEGQIYVEDFTLMPVSNCVKLTESLEICADNVSENEKNLYELSGNVNINEILYFTGNITVDKRNHLFQPEISGSCGFYADDIQGGAMSIYESNLPFVFYATGDELVSKQLALFCEIPITIFGFPLKLGGMQIDAEGSELSLKVLPQFPFPLDKIMQSYYNLTPPEILKKVSLEIILSKENGLSYAGRLEDLEMDYKIFKFEDVELEVNTGNGSLSCGFNLTIPGGEDEEKCAGLTGPVDTTYIQEFLSELPVTVLNEEGDTLSQLKFSDLLSDKGGLFKHLLGFGMQIGFVEGGIDNITISISAKIPIASTGLFITEMTGGVKDLQTDQWKFNASVDIETGMELPVLGSPVKLDDFGLEIAPFTYFKGSGALEIFKSQVANGSMEYDYKKNSLAIDGNLNLHDVLRGKVYTNVWYQNFRGGGTMCLKTPGDLPWYLNWAENKVLGSVQTDIHNLEMKAKANYGWLSLATKTAFGNPSFPYFHFYLGTNYENLYQIWKGMRGLRQGIIFQVPENTKQIFIVAGDTVNAEMLDFILLDPQGTIFDTTNSHYQRFDDSRQTVMVLDNPLSGNWEFLTDYTEDIALETMFLNQSPTVLISQPQSKQSKSSNIHIGFTDYSDTLTAEIYYDTDNRNFDGKLIQSFELTNNATIDFTWENQDLQNGEYFIFCRLDDGRNAPVLQYSPGSILVENDLSIETPQNLSVIQTGDTVTVQWDMPVFSNTSVAIVYIKNASDFQVEENAVTDTNFIRLNNFDCGQKYYAWCSFLNDHGNLGNASYIESFDYYCEGINNPPCFTMNPDSMWVLIQGHSGHFGLSATDIDDSELYYAVPGDTLGIEVNNDSLSWQPSAGEEGVYQVLITVTDGSNTDSLYQQIAVMSENYAEINSTFSSSVLYQDDNMFAIIKNYNSGTDIDSVTVTNLRTSEQIRVACSRVNESDFIGQFRISSGIDSELPVMNGDSLQVQYSCEGSDYYSYAVFDSLPQSKDNTAPDAITDLQVVVIGNNRIKLSWTASGDDNMAGSGFRYDLRYSYSEIQNEEDYLSAFLYETCPYPSIAGVIDSLIIDLSEIQSVEQNDTVFFALKEEDEMMNRSPLGNCANISYFLVPEELEATLADADHIQLGWQDLQTRFPEMINFSSYSLFRQSDSSGFDLLADNILDSVYTDNLHGYPDGQYQYGLQVVYNEGLSDMVFSAVIDMDRFSLVRILCSIEGTNDFSGINVTLVGLDTVYHQTYDWITNQTGLVLLANVFHSEYYLHIAKEGFSEVNDTISISSESNQFAYSIFPQIHLSLKAYLEGPFNGSEMNSELVLLADFPLSQPYNTPPWNYNGTESVTEVPSGTVDWILVELRDAQDAPSATPATMIARQAAFLMSDGNIRSTDGTSNQQFDNSTIQHSLFAVIYHRNHLAIMSALPLSESGGIYSWDFRTGAGQAYNNGQKNIASGVWGMFAGDANASGTVDMSDKTDAWEAQAGSRGYLSGDLNLDGQADNTDKNEFWFTNTGTESQVPD